VIAEQETVAGRRQRIAALTVVSTPPAPFDAAPRAIVPPVPYCLNGGAAPPIPGKGSAGGNPPGAASGGEISMAKPITVSIGDSALTIDSGHLTRDSFARFSEGGLTLVSDVLAAAAGRPISALPTDTLQAVVKAGGGLSWTIGNIDLQVTPGAEGSLTIRRAGEVFRFTETEQDDDPARRHVVTVPAGKAYVSLALRVNIGVSGAGGFSQGAIGVSGSAQVADSFLLANHCQVDAAATVAEAVRAVGERFLLPFDGAGYREIQDGDLLEYEFYGKLDVGLQTSLGFSGVFFGGASGGEVRRSFSSPIGSVAAQAKPSFDLGAKFSVGYGHEDAFRMVLWGQRANSRLFVFKKDRSTLSAGVQANAGVRLNAAVTLAANVDGLIDEAAQRLFSGVADATLRNALIGQFRDKVKSNASDLDRYVKDAERRVNQQIQKLDRLSVSASLTRERISVHTALLSVEFDRAAPPDGFSRAVHGDLAGALQAQGARLAPGSYTAAEIQRTTSLRFQLFETFRASSIQTYFSRSELRYAGDGVFQFRFTAGVKAENDIFGHRKAIEFYFEIGASATAKGAISDQDVTLRVRTTDSNSPAAAHCTANMLELILPGAGAAHVVERLRQALQQSPGMTVNVSLEVRSSAYARVAFSPFAGGKPPRDQRADASNYAAFVRAVDAVYAGGGFETQGFPRQAREFRHWAHYNITAIDREGATRPADRRSRGNGATDSVWPKDSAAFPAAGADRSIRPMLRAFLIAAQQFMNFCEDLPTLARDLNEATTREVFERVLDQAKDLVKEGAGAFPLLFTKPTLAAFVAQSGGVVQDVQGPAPGEPAGDAFDVRVTVA
jgi:hypothetical protein